MKSSFAPVTDRKTRVLVLGSLPGDVPLARGEYYANPRNQFWRLIGHAISVDLSQHTYDERLAILRAHGVGLWDVVRNAERVGSLDADIRNLTTNTLAEIAATLPKLRALAFNGGKAFAVGRKQFSAGVGPRLIVLHRSAVQTLGDAVHPAGFFGRSARRLRAGSRTRRKKAERRRRAATF